MNARDAFIHMIDRSGMPKTRLSVALGKTEGYVNAYVSQGRTPGTQAFAAFAEACGYSLQIVGHGETITIDGDTASE